MYKTETMHTLDMISDRDFNRIMQEDFGVQHVGPCDVSNDSDHRQSVGLDETGKYWWGNHWDVERGKFVPLTWEICRAKLESMIETKTHSYGEHKGEEYKELYISDTDFNYMIGWMHFEHGWPLGDWLIRVSW